MEGEVLRDDQWDRLREFVPGGRKGKRGPVATVGCFSTPCGGWLGQADAGVICRSGSVPIRRPRFSPIAPMTPTARITSSTSKAVNRSSRPAATATASTAMTASLQTALGHRRILRQAQAEPPYRHTLRQTRRHLPRFHQARQHHAMTQMIKSSLQSSGR